MSIEASKEPSHRNCIERSKKNRIEFDYSQPRVTYMVLRDFKLKQLFYINKMNCS